MKPKCSGSAVAFFDSFFSLCYVFLVIFFLFLILLLLLWSLNSAACGLQPAVACGMFLILLLMPFFRPSQVDDCVCMLAVFWSPRSVSRCHFSTRPSKILPTIHQITGNGRTMWPLLTICTSHSRTRCLMVSSLLCCQLLVVVLVYV